MRRSIVAVLACAELLVACAIFACSLQLSHRIARSHTLGNLASHVVESTHSLAATTRRIAQSSVQVHITIGDA